MASHAENYIFITFCFGTLKILVDIEMLKCCSEFKDIFDFHHFFDTLKEDVHIIDFLPASLKNVEPLKKALVSWSKVK